MSAVAVMPEAPFRPEPLDLADLRRNPPTVTWLAEPYVPAAARIWAWGPAESAKSMWAMHMAAQLSRQGHHVVVLSQENTLSVEFDRIERTSADERFLRVFHDQGFDLARQDHSAVLLDLAAGASFVVIDTLTACWRGDEADNRAIAEFDARVLMPLVKAGATVLVIHHTGHGGAGGIRRRGADAGRGASSQGQKADVVLEFDRKADNTFLIRHGKNRMGLGQREPDTYFRITDRDDGSLEIQTAGRPPGRGEKAAARTQQDAETVIQLLMDVGPLSRSELTLLLASESLSKYRVDKALEAADEGGRLSRPSGARGPYAAAQPRPTSDQPL